MVRRYLQPVACRWYWTQNWILWNTIYYRCLIRICVFYTDNKLSIQEIWCVPLDWLISKTQKRFLIKLFWSFVSNTSCESIRTILVRRPESKKNLLSEILWNLIEIYKGHCFLIKYDSAHLNWMMNKWEQGKPEKIQDTILRYWLPRNLNQYQLFRTLEYPLILRILGQTLTCPSNFKSKP